MPTRDRFPHCRSPRGPIPASLLRAASPENERPSLARLMIGAGQRHDRYLSAAAKEYRLAIHPVILGAGERLFPAPLTIEPVSTTVFSGGAVAHVFTAHP